MTFINDEYDHYLKFFALFVVLYTLIKFIIRPYLRLRILKMKYGDKAEIYFYPFLGNAKLYIEGQSLKDAAERIFLEARRRNPKMKVFISNFGSQISYQLNDPQLINKFAMDQEKYTKYEDILFLDCILLDAIFQTHGEKWKRQRRFLSPFFTYDAISQRAGAINLHANKFVDAMAGDDNRNKLYDFLKLSVGNIICHTFFGEEVTKLKLNNQFITLELQNVIETIFALSFQSPYTLIRNQILGTNSKSQIPDFLLSSQEKKLWKRLSDIRSAFSEIIEKRIQQYIDKTSPDQSDFLEYHIKEYLTSKKAYQDQADERSLDYDSEEFYRKNKEKYMTKEEILQQFIGFYFAGTDTTSHLLLIVIYYLGQHPEIQEKLREEIRSNINDAKNIQFEEIKKLTTLQSFIYEVMRVRSPVPQTLLRVSQKDHEIDGWLQVLKGDCVDAQFTANFRSSQYYPEPEKFDVERFKDLKKIDHQAFTPFFSGPHNCIGQHMALLEVKMIVAKLLSEFRVEQKPGYELSMTLTFLYQPQDKKLANLVKI